MDSDGQGSQVRKHTMRLLAAVDTDSEIGDEAVDSGGH